MQTRLYPHLARLANDWQGRMGVNVRYSDDRASFLERCHGAGQTRPTPLLLQYVPRDFNCLHQDLYGDLAFPIQVAILLSEPGRDFTGGEFVLTEQRPRMQATSMGWQAPILQIPFLMINELTEKCSNNARSTGARLRTTP